jgi:uncharacterized protein with PIN domain
MTVKFFCDNDVLRLAKWLRFAGFDTITKKELSKKKIVNYCLKYKRILITRNHKKKITNCLLDDKITNNKLEILESNNIFQQLEYITNKYNINKDLIATICIVCNKKLLNYENDEKFCSKCGRKFYKGSNYLYMLNILMKLINNNH